MKPTGLASRKKLRSVSVSSVPERPNMTGWINAVRPSTARYARAQDEAIFLMPSKIVPHPELVEGRRMPMQRQFSARSRLDKDAPDIAAFERCAALGGLCAVGDWPSLDAVEDAFVAEIDARGGERELA